MWTVSSGWCFGLDRWNCLFMMRIVIMLDYAFR